MRIPSLGLIVPVTGLLLLGACSGSARSGGRSLVLATTTSAQDSGILDSLVPLFEREAGIAVKVIAVGTIPELLKSDHPWIQEYFNGPRGRAAHSGAGRAKGMDKPGNPGE